VYIWNFSRDRTRQLVARMSEATCGANRSPDIASLIRATRYSMFAYFLHCTKKLHRLRELSAGRSPKHKSACET
jgi:hypothetical protein